MRSCLKNDGLIAGSFRPPPDAAFGSAPKLYRIPYWLKGGEGVNLNFAPANSPATILAVAYCQGWSKNQKNGHLMRPLSFVLSGGRRALVAETGSTGALSLRLNL